MLESIKARASREWTSIKFRLVAKTFCFKMAFEMKENERKGNKRRREIKDATERRQQAY